PPLDRTLLSVMRLVVPVNEREEWMRSWQAEIWHQHHQAAKPNLASGLIQDALWLRAESCREAFSGTATLCLATLTLLLAIAALPVLVAAGSWKALVILLAHSEQRVAIEAVLIVFVSLAASAGYVERSTLLN